MYGFNVRDMLPKLIQIYANEADNENFACFVSKDTMSYTPALFQDSITIIRSQGIWVDSEVFSRFKRMGEKAFMMHMNLQSENVYSITIPSMLITLIGIIRKCTGRVQRPAG